ncbi:hypothetical protein [Mammaliicoccus lentus]|uniref:hypothetical protein n=1 Tax=Mammaliicoccus lentus TaxID=42858 RepID=UPI001071BDF8|nr:hypothetical protein [Mammaliicoccus lentus]MBF0795230.1 hypothetical protein [Mammaliicoccus lentus]TFV14626.1 hypothetical protein E4T78_11215 [Mammaliicoccus lentus]
MSVIMCKDKEIEAKVVAENYVLDSYEEYQKGNIDLKTLGEEINVFEVERYVRAERPYIAEQIGDEMLGAIIAHVVTKYFMEIS